MASRQIPSSLRAQSFSQPEISEIAHNYRKRSSPHIEPLRSQPCAHLPTTTTSTTNESNKASTIGIKDLLLPPLESLDPNNNNINDFYIQALPPNPPYVGCSPTICHLVKTTPCCLCCLKLLNQACIHSSMKNQISDYKFRNKMIILAAASVNVSMYNFIVPLRSFSLNQNSLNPILLLLEKDPDESFLEIIKFFPLVFWMKGSIDCLEDLLRAGINDAEYLIIINKETFDVNNGERGLHDTRTIMAVQYIFRMFPKIKICSEIIDSNNMRFVKFKAHDHFSQQISKREKYERMKGSQIAYLFRLPFASGSVFSAAMLDTLLYQSFIKPYLIEIVRLMIGIDQAPGSGYLSSVSGQ